MKISDKRGDIMQAALELVAEHGFHGAPISEIAKKAGVGAGTIYLSFENKDLLITELYRELEEKIIENLLKNYSAGRPIRERFVHIANVLLRYFIEHPLHFRYIEQYLNSPYGVSLRRNVILGKFDNLDIFMNLFEQGIAQQVLKELPVFVHFALAFGPLITLARDHILGLAILDDTLILQVIDACWDGIKR
jgi:AcrR family transcriptional regulator